MMLLLLLMMMMMMMRLLFRVASSWTACLPTGLYYFVLNAF